MKGKKPSWTIYNKDIVIVRNFYGTLRKNYVDLIWAVRAAALCNAFNLLASIRALCSSEMLITPELFATLSGAWFTVSFSAEDASAATILWLDGWDGSWEIHKMIWLKRKISAAVVKKRMPASNNRL